MMQEKVMVLALSLHDEVIGYLAGFQGGRNIVSFSPEYIHAKDSPTLTLTQLNKPEILQKPWITHQRLHAVFSNLLPEGAMRTWLAQSLKVHEENEFPLFAYLGEDLPGALIVKPANTGEIPAWALCARKDVEPVILPILRHGQGFSLAGVQLKFSGNMKEGRYHVSGQGELGGWIVKTPSTLHAGVPLNEYSMMKLAALAGIDIPDIMLISMKDLNGLPNIQLPAETYAYAIRRFDRKENGVRIHSEDFAQILQCYPHEKYQRNYELMGRIMYQHTADGLGVIQQFARRLLVNILLGNGDAHLKNWSLYYPNHYTPTLAPAYDILYTQAYIASEAEIALNLGNEKRWYALNMHHFERWAQKIGVSWPAISVHLNEAINQARALWPQALQDLPMLEHHKIALKRHWSKLAPEWRIDAAKN